MSTGVGSQTPALQISAPKDGVVVQPGSSVAVTVTSPSGAPFAYVVVIGERAVDLIAGSPKLPLQASARIPADAPLRRYRLHASGRTPAGQEIEAPPVVIDVERNDMPASLSPLNGFDAWELEAAGPDQPINVLARFPDGAILDATESSRVRYSVADPRVVSVSAAGVMTPRAAGRTSVTVVYSLGAKTLQMQVAVTVRSGGA